MLCNALFFLAVWTAVAGAAMTCALFGRDGARTWRANHSREPAAYAWHRTQKIVRTLMMLCVMCCCAAGSWPTVLANGSSCQSDLRIFTDPRYLHVTSPAVVSTKNAAPKLGTEIAKKADFEKLPGYCKTVPAKNFRLKQLHSRSSQRATHQRPPDRAVEWVGGTRSLGRRKRISRAPKNFQR